MEMILFVVCVVSGLYIVMPVMIWLVGTTARGIGLIVSSTSFLLLSPVQILSDAWRKERLKRALFDPYNLGSRRQFPNSGLIRTNDQKKQLLAMGATLREVLGNCCEAVVFSAEVFQVEHLSDLQDYHVVIRMRQRVVDSIDIALEKLNSSAATYSSAELLKMSVGLEVMRDVCHDCEMMRYLRPEAPRLCSPARTIGYVPAGKAPEAEE